MRDIKFRAWNKYYNKYTPWGAIKNNYFAAFIDVNYLLEQYIGLKDKNGKEIYEGDIVKPFFDEINMAKIIFMNGGFKIATKKKNGKYLIWNYMQSEIEIIGNIHENKNLL